MLTLKQFMELCDYRITEGSEYGWRCYGDRAYSLSAWNGDYKGWSMNIVFDTRTQEVYEADVCDYKNDRAYRLFGMGYQSRHDAEAQERDHPGNQAWDDVCYVDLETDEDFLEKSRAIVAGEDYDTRVAIPLNMPEDVAFQLMRMAHDQDITFNQLVESIISDEIDRIKNNDPGIWLSDDLDHLDEDDETPSRKPVAKMKKSKGKKK